MTDQFFDKVFKSKDGKVIIWQTPNAPLWGWILCTVLAVISKRGNVHSGLQALGGASLFTWAYLEIRAGDSLFRRVLGVIIMAGIVYGFFK